MEPFSRESIEDLDEPEDLEKIKDLEEIESILTELRLSKGKGNLILCTVISPAYRGMVIQVIKKRFSSKVLSIEYGDQLISTLRKEISTLKEEEPNESQVLVWILPETLDAGLLEALNNFRELFYATKNPNLLFLTPSALEQVIKQAPDFWRYRGGFHELKGREQGLVSDAMEVLATPLKYRNKEDLLRRKRIDEHLLGAIKDNGERLGIISDLGTVLFLLSEYKCSIEIYEKAVALARNIGDKRSEGNALVSLGNIYSSLGQTQKAIVLYEEGLKIYCEIEDKSGLSAALCNLGLAYAKQRNARKAIEFYERALEVSRVAREKSIESAILDNLGNAYSDLGDSKKAIELYEKALKIACDIGDKRGEGIVLGNLGNSYASYGNTQRAIEFYKKALDINRKIGNLLDEGGDLFNIGLLLDALDKRSQAIEYAEAALKIFKQIESPRANRVEELLREWHMQENSNSLS
jgi:tetratricopeptide (TPR) repeat protein